MVGRLKNRGLGDLGNEDGGEEREGSQRDIGAIDGERMGRARGKGREERKKKEVETS